MGYKRDQDKVQGTTIKDFKRVLSRCNLESYFFDNAVIQALAASVGKAKSEEPLSTMRLKLSFYLSHKHLTAPLGFQGALPHPNNRPTSRTKLP